MNEKANQDTNHAMSFEEFAKTVESSLSPIWRAFAEPKWNGKSFLQEYEAELRECYKTNWLPPQGLAGAIMCGL